jgi:hypothetical protein
MRKEESHLPFPELSQTTSRRVAVELIRLGTLNSGKLMDSRVSEETLQLLTPIQDAYKIMQSLLMNVPLTPEQYDIMRDQVGDINSQVYRPDQPEL